MIGRAGVLQECVQRVEGAIGPPRNERKEGRNEGNRSEGTIATAGCAECADIYLEEIRHFSLQGIVNHFESWAAGMGVSLKHPAPRGTLWV